MAGIVVAVAVLAVGVPSLALLAAAPLRVTAGTVPLFAGLTLAWVVFGVVAAGVDNLLDPARFALLPVRAPELARGLLAAALTGVPAVATAGLALGQAAAWLTRPAAFAAALVAAVLGTFTAVLLARAVTGVLAGLMTSHVGRVAGAAVVAVVTVLPLAANLVLSGGSIVVDSAVLDLSEVAVVVSWTPVGWVWALPLDVATGRWVAAAAHLFLAAALLVLLWRVWVGRLEQVLTAPPTAGGGHRIGRARVLPVILGRSPAATVAARRVRAWYRDSRLVSVALRTVVLPVFFVAQAAVTGAGEFAGAGVVTLAVIAGLTLMNDLAYDGPAWWVHVATGLRGWEDRLGRAAAATVVFGPVLVGTFAASVWLGLLPDALGWAAVVGAAFPASLGLAVGVGAVLPGTAPRTGGNPFAATSGGAAQGCLTALVSLIGPVLLVVPVVVLVLATDPGPAGEWLFVAVGSGYGAALLAAGVVLGGWWMDRRAPELLDRLQRAQF
ncbi:MAG: hypothetical protein ACRCYX_04960 [Dermatophilaceae bacterium]